MIKVPNDVVPVKNNHGVPKAKSLNDQVVVNKQRSDWSNTQPECVLLVVHVVPLLDFKIWRYCHEVHDNTW